MFFQSFHTSVFLGFSVYVSNSTNKEDGVLCFRDKNYTTATIPNPVNITCPYHGRYVTYYNNRTHPPYPFGYSSSTLIGLCEVEVYGCSDGQYGYNCVENCSVTCRESDNCDKITGHCIGGCRAGWTGDMCKTGWEGNMCQNGK
uniref:Uncharacterized protein LOC111113839 n=1 Tax=Crassostrea virginica TaxID=6565 RepID=A0A8B8BYB3_CRAVI|nr:uncharacterized protein LOC111113839 [Crassostrea virginica]